ncbi:MAG: Spy/CpxP family protein refolding chaperone [Proteobacteria bacterium]|nr:Spy/CpxP family protein refolding chaperone [Pseudomonadota bacterium]
MSFRKILLSACVSGAMFAGGTASHALAADHPREMAGKMDMAAWHKRMCTDRYARNVGRVAYIEAKLSLNDTQRPLFDGWKQTVLGSAKSHEDSCLARQPHMDGGHNILERQARMRDMLQHRLADLTAEQPSLKALYDSLSPDQKQVFDHGDRMGGPQGHGGWHHGPHGAGAPGKAE